MVEGDTGGAIGVDRLLICYYDVLEGCMVCYFNYADLIE